MPRTKRILASDLTVADLKRLLAAKEQIAPLEEKKAKLEAELAAVSAQLAKLVSGAKPAVRRGRKPGRKPGRPVAKKVGRRVAKKAGRPVAKKVVRRVVKKAAPKPPATPGIQDVVVGLIRENGEPMEFKAIMAAIKKGKLVKTKSKDFANVLRRTLSTSTRVKRVARGVYGVKG